MAGLVKTEQGAEQRTVLDGAERRHLGRPVRTGELLAAQGPIVMCVYCLFSLSAADDESVFPGRCIPTHTYTDM